MNTSLKRRVVYFIIILLTFLFIASPTICEDTEDNKVIISYPTKEGVYYTESQPNIFQLKKDGNYEVLAYISPVTEKKERIFNAHEVDLTNVLKKEGPSLKTEITNDGLLILNRPKESHLGKDKVKFEIPLPEQGISIEEYPIFQISYQELNPLSPVGMGIRFHLDTDGDGKIDTTAFAKAPEAISGKLVKSIDFSKVDFVPKSYSYILYRKLGIKMDEKWRYVQDGENLVIQRRFYEDLKQVPLIKLFFDKRYKVNRINFLVDFNKNKIPDAIIEFEDTIHKSFNKGDLEGIAINLLESVKKLFPKKKDIFLTEVFIFVEGNKNSILKQMPLKRLGFYQRGIKEVEGELLLVEADLKEEEQQKYLTIDLSEIEKENIYLAKIKRADLVLEFSGDVPSVMVFKKMVFCDVVEEETPLVLNEIKWFVRKLGIQTNASEEIILIPEIKFWEDFSMLPEDIERWSIKKADTSNIKNTYLILQRHIDIGIDKNTYVCCDYEGEGIIVYLSLKWWERGDEHEERFVMPPNIPIKIDKLKDKKIEKISLIFSSLNGSLGSFGKYEKSWDIKLKSIIFFRLIPVQESQFLNTYINSLETPIPILFNQLSPSSKEIFVWEKGNMINMVWRVSSASLLDVTLGCSVNKSVEKIQDISFLSFRYKIDPDLSQLNPHWLKIIIGLEKEHRTETIVLNPYLDKDEAWVNLPLGEKLRNKHILWVHFKVHIKEIPAFKPYLFEIKDVYISKTYIASLIARLWDKEILAKIDNYEIKAQDILRILCNDHSAKGDFLNGGAWVNLGKLSFSEGEHEVEFTEHKYLKIDALFLKGETPISVAFLKPKTPVKSLSGRVIGWGLKVTFLGFIFFCLYLVYYFRRLYMPLWNKFDKVCSFVPIWTKVIIFPILGICLYLLGLTRKVGQGENYLFTFGGIFLVLGYHYLSLLLKPWWLKHHERVGNFIYRSSGSIYIIGFIITLIIAAFFLVFGIEPIAEQMSVIGYYLLVVGVIKEFLAFKKSTSNY
ncbi:MAG TPA: hypothetical protein ENI35_00395 [Candidatus Desulfofervidus auxilii]|uniref:Uncharacterized protein n=1 Tax=Desulfofervidus auxilii TaxID=1621989 RepID=A0A7C1ZDW4_DESA2|nr:hypothetical protein [Candidatus Desulfofervidus auxilii]